MAGNHHYILGPITIIARMINLLGALTPSGHY